jgi:hypothetical protein
MRIGELKWRVTGDRASARLNWMNTSAPPLTIADRLRAERRASFVGRELELERMLRQLDDDRAQVTFVLGSGGIGKTRLGACSGLIETVTGHGSRLSEFELRLRSGPT